MARARHAGTGAVLTAWQATPSISSGASLRQRSNASGQRGLKAQPGGGLIGFGISPFTGMRWRPRHCEIGHGAEQHLGVGHARTGEQLASFRDLDDAAEIHHADAARHVADHGEVVADEHVGQAELVLEVAHQVQDLRLHGETVERGGRLVETVIELPRRRQARERSRCADAGRPRIRAEISACRRDAGRQG